MFEPPRCPRITCPAHTEPRRDDFPEPFYIRKGFFKPRCRAVPVQRFQCRICERGFSRQTFRADYRDRKPHLNKPLFWALASGNGLRQLAREIDLTKNNLVKKARKIARHCRHLNLNLLGLFRGDVTLQFDELETFEGCRSTRPVTLPILIHSDSMLLIGSAAGRIPASGRMTPKRREAIEREELRSGGPRPDESSEVCREVFDRAAERTAEDARVTLRSDFKTTYPKLAKDAFGARLVAHEQTHSKEIRDALNPLHRINLMLAKARDQLGRLRRRSWLVSKKRVQLALHMELFAAYRNWNRPRFNGEEESPGELVGFIPRRLVQGEVLGWRQDFGRERSIKPWDRCSV